MRKELTEEDKKDDIIRIEEILNSKFNVDSKERYWFFQMKENRKYVLASPSYIIEPDYRWDGFPMWKNVVLFKDIESGSIVAFQPELLLLESTNKNTTKYIGDVNVALRKFIKIRPLSTNRDVSIFLSEYIGDKEVYLIFDKSKPVNGWIGSFNLFTQPSLHVAIKAVKG